MNLRALARALRRLEHGPVGDSVCPRTNAVAGELAIDDATERAAILAREALATHHLAPELREGRFP